MNGLRRAPLLWFLEFQKTSEMDGQETLENILLKDQRVKLKISFFVPVIRFLFPFLNQSLGPTLISGY